MKGAQLIAAACFAICSSPGVAANDTVTGTVVDSESGAPLSHARVTATLWKGNDYQHLEVLAILTGDDGRFSFTALPLGKCDIRVQKSEYVGTRSFSVNIEPGRVSEPLTLKLIPLGAITVAVVDDHGVPLCNAVIRIHSTSAQGYPDASDHPTGQDGKVRLPLSRGSYRIEARNPGSNALLRTKGLTYARVFHAEAIDVVPGKEKHIDLVVTPVPGREIRGRVDISGTLISIYVSSSVKDDYQLTWGTTQFDVASRDFSVSGLPPGVYVIDASVCLIVPCEYAVSFTRTVEIVSSDITDLVITQADRRPEQ
jgi:hypothetical protein